MSALLDFDKALFQWLNTATENAFMLAMMLSLALPRLTGFFILGALLLHTGWLPRLFNRILPNL